MNEITAEIDIRHYGITPTTCNSCCTRLSLAGIAWHLNLGIDGLGKRMVFSSGAMKVFYAAFKTADASLWIGLTLIATKLFIYLQMNRKCEKVSVLI